MKIDSACAILAIFPPAQLTKLIPSLCTSLTGSSSVAGVQLGMGMNSVS